jgi:hypothetical protein
LIRLHHNWAFIAVVMLFVLLGASSRAGAAPRKLTVDEARELASEALEPRQAKLPGLTFQPYDDKSFPDYLSFEVLWDNPVPDGSTVVIDLSVDPQTGDVFKRGGCSASSPALVKLQKTMRKRIGLNEQEYKNLRHPGPPC